VWVEFCQQTHIPADIRVGDTLRLTGDTGGDAGRRLLA
jgi:hypothetical protein